MIVDDEDFLGPEPTKGAFKPMLAVNRNGVVGAFWYDRREAGSSWSYRPRFAVSFDGGDSFTPSVVLSESRMAVNEGDDFELFAFLDGNLFLGSVSHAGFEGGETNGFTVDSDGDFHAVWVDNRTGVSQLWTSRISVEGAALPNGSPELASFAELKAPTGLEVASLIESTAPSVEVIDARAYPSRHVVGVQARLFNGTKEAIHGPVVLRSVSSRSLYGKFRPANPTNGVKGPGAVWNISDALPNGSLAPGQRSKTFILEFEYPPSAWPWKKVHPEIQGFGFQSDLRILVKKTQ
jgi:hypothetical protein